MSIVELPVWRLRGHTGRVAPRSGLANGPPQLRVVSQAERSGPNAYCDRCAAPIEHDGVMHGRGVFCSVECSLEGPLRPV